MALEIRPLAREHVEAATRLGRAAFSGVPEQPDFADELGRSIAHTWVVLEDGALVGYALAWLVADEAQLMSIAVDAEARGRGLGRALLARFLDELAHAGARSVVLEVREGNVAARALYASLGFTTIGARRRYYADGEDAVTYAWRPTALE